jgi:hypothetical protein
MLSSALRTEEHREIPNPTRDCDEGPPGLEVRASYHGVLIGTRFLPEAEPRRRLRAVGVAAPGSRYTIGASATADAPASCELLGATDMALVTKWGAGFMVNVTPGMRGDVAVGGKVYRLADYLAGRGTNFTLPPDGRARIECGAMSYELAHATAAAPLPRRWLAWRWAEQRFTLGTLVGLALFMVMIFAIPPEETSVSTSFEGMTRVYLPYDVLAKQAPEVPEFLTKQPDKGMGEAGKAHLGKSGKMGDPKSKKPSGRYAIAGDGKDMHLGKEQAAERIRTTGFLGVLGKAAGSQFTSIFGRDTAVGDAQEDIMGNLLAADLGNGFGFRGLGLTGTGYGGGGAGLGTIGIGKYNTLGGGYGHDRHIGALDRKPEHKVRGVIPGVVTTKGSLDKEIIRRIVRAHMNEVKFCYEKELATKTGLGGRVSLQFIISGNGQVISSFVQSTTMNNIRVESCVAGAVKRWSFPKPDGGGIAIVSYPFNFVSGS